MIIASGMVTAMVNSPHGLSASAFTTTRPSTASRMVMIASRLIIATRPMTGLISSLSIWPSDFPSRRIEAKQHHRIMHPAAERGADQDPQHARQIAELRRQHRPHQRPRPGDGREMVAEDHPLVRRHEVLAVAARHRGGRAAVVEGQHLGHQPGAVKPIGHREGADARDDQPQGVDRFAALESGDADGGGTEQGNGDPEEDAGDTRHVESG